VSAPAVPDLNLTTPTQLPHPRTPFVGREWEATAVSGLLMRPDVPLVTLTGPSGVGKSRLAIHVAEILQDRYEGNLWFVPLASVSDPDRVLPTIARALDIWDSTGVSLEEGICTRLGDREGLIVIDNFEHLVVAAPTLSNLLLACSNLKLLVTSRVPLRLTGEHEYSVPPLDTSGLHVGVPLEVIASNDAVNLFLKRARALNPDFMLTETNAAAVVEICRRLDGLPLAIELAAARVKVLSPTALLARLTHRLQVLTGGPRDLPVRLQTMRDAIAWSYELLAPEEQALFRRLSVFSRGFTLEAAEQVVQDTAEPPSERDPFAIERSTWDFDLLDRLTALVDSSLIRRDELDDSDLRFSMLQTIREFGQEQARLAGEEDDLCRRHADWALSFAQNARLHLWGPSSLAWLDRLEREHDNLREALIWAIEHEAEMALRLVGALWWFWQTRGYLGEGRRLTDQALAKAPNAPSSVRIEALFGASFLAVMQGDAVAGLGYANEGFAAAERLGDQHYVAQMLYVRSFAEGGKGNHEKAHQLASESVETFRGMGDDEWLPLALNRLGVETSELKDPVQGQRHFEEALAFWRRASNDWGVATALINLAISARMRGENLRAAHALLDCLPLAQKQGDMWGVAETLVTLAGIAEDEGHYEPATKFLAASEAVREKLGLRLQRYVDAVGTSDANLRKQLGDVAFQEAWTAGKRASIDEMLDLGRSIFAEPAASSPPQSAARASVRPRRAPMAAAPAKATTPVSVLTARELEVLGLLAEGMSSRDIGNALFISPRTATTHITNIFAKLDVDNRAAAVAKAFQLGII
jgi:predicted ATPase/DNA-binding CsgD family transcriptional regulator